MLTGHDYDFVGIIETKTEKPLTFFFGEELCEHDEEEEYEWSNYWDYEDNIDENKTELLGMYEGLKEYEDGCDDEIQIKMWDLNADGYFRTRDDKRTGFLSNPRERGQFLAIAKAYCPEKIKEIPWAA